MKKLLVLIALSISTTAFAWDRGYGHWEHRGGGWNWVVPTVIGGVIGYEIARPPIYTQPPVVVQQPVIVEQPVVTQQQICSPWVQTKQPDGSVITTRTCK